MQALCRDCLEDLSSLEETPSRCPACGGRRIIAHPELHHLTIAHIDCDAFYATVEKRDDPSIRDKPVIVGGGQRGVVSAACYTARIYGVRSAMPMFKALAACPDAVVIRPNMKKYSEEGQRIRERMLSLTPLVEPLSIDEAFLDLTGTQRLHRASPATKLAGLVLEIEKEMKLSASIGLSYNKFLAKVASDLDKPRGFAVIGQAEALDFLTDKPVSMLWGVGKALQGSLLRDGIRTIGDLRPYEEEELMRRYGTIGRRLYRFSRGEDHRSVDPRSPAKSISSETTFDQDVADLRTLEKTLWRLCEKVSLRLKKAELAAGGITLKLKSKDFRTLTRSRKIQTPTQLADRLFREAQPLLAAQADGTSYRLIGIGGADLTKPQGADAPDLLEPDRQKRAQVERAIDKVRAKLGEGAILKGRGLKT